MSMNTLLSACPGRRVRRCAALCALLVLSAATATVLLAAPKPAPDTMEERAKPCVVCHTDEGRADKDTYYPRLAGKPAGYLFNQMRHFRDGRRAHRAMTLLMENLSDDFLRALAVYFAGLPVRYLPAARVTAAAAAGTTTMPALVKDGDAARRIPACAACHGKKLLGAAPAIPGLLGLPRDYISAQFGAWRVGTRVATAPDCMGDIARLLNQAEVTSIAEWLAAQDLPSPASFAITATRASAGAVDPETAKACGSVNDALSSPISTVVSPAVAGKAVRP
jgi:cytochrome c553